MHSGFAIALAWPDTLCKQAGAWYDGLMFWLGINKNYYYKVGHAAVVLVDASTGVCKYFDFGRYHSPSGSGRVRSAETDFDLRIKTKAIISSSGDSITNLDNILSEIFSNKSCHGDGHMHASYVPIDYTSSLSLAINMQNSSPIKYGPFILEGTNCSRFVRSVILAGLTQSSFKRNLFLQFSITPTPIGNVNALKNKLIINDSYQYAR